MSDVRAKKNLPRHSAGSMELREGTGPITAMCSCGSFLEVYKRDKTFRIQTPESIDPSETNANVPWVASPYADVGSSNLTVARVLLQAREMLDMAVFDESFNKDAVIVHLHACKESLLSCEKIATRIIRNIDDIVQQITKYGVSKDNGGRGLNPFPQVPDLDTDCGMFLIQANRAIKLVCELPKHFIRLDKTDSNFDYLSKRLAEAVGEASPLTKFARARAHIVRYLIDLRNFHEHPKHLRTVIENFRILPNTQIQVPTWYVAGGNQTVPHPIKEEVVSAVDFIRDLAEIMFIHLLMHRISRKFPYFIERVADEKLDPTLPIRYRLSIDIETHIAKSGEQEAPR